MRARMAIVASGLSVELREVVLKNKPPELVAASPKATVPVMLSDDGSILDQSLDILQWALSVSDPLGWKNFSIEVLAEMETLVAQNDFKFKPDLDHYKYSDRYPERSKEADRGRCETFLHVLEVKLQQHIFLFGEEISYADIAIFPFIRQFSKVDENWFTDAPYPALKQWLENLINSKLFNLVMRKYKRWNSSDPVVIFPDQQSVLSADGK